MKNKKRGFRFLHELKYFLVLLLILICMFAVQMLSEPKENIAQYQGLISAPGYFVTIILINLVLFPSIIASEFFQWDSKTAIYVYSFVTIWVGIITNALFWSLVTYPILRFLFKGVMVTESRSKSSLTKK